MRAAMNEAMPGAPSRAMLEAMRRTLKLAIEEAIQ
jgi:hypothetical protein